MIVTVLLAVPPVPVQLKLYELETAKGPVTELPDTTLPPDHAPVAVQLLALVTDQVNVDELPALTNAGLAENVITGAALVSGSVGVGVGDPPPVEGVFPAVDIPSPPP